MDQPVGPADETDEGANNPPRPLGEKLDEILGPAHLLSTESSEKYTRRYRQLRAALAPQDDVDEILVKKYVDLTWEADRLDRLKVALFRAGKRELLSTALKSILGVEEWEAYDLEPDAAREGSRSNRRARNTLHQGGYDDDCVDALTLRRWMQDYERLEQLLAQNERRQAAILQDLARRQELAAVRRLRGPADTVEDAQVAADDGTPDQ